MGSRCTSSPSRNWTGLLAQPDMPAVPFGNNNETDALATRLHRWATSTEGRVIVGVTGTPGAGKTTLVKSLLSNLYRLDPDSGRWATQVPMDGFHLADVALDELGLRDRKGAPETFDVDGYINLLSRIRTDDKHVIYAPAFERTIEQPIAASIAITPMTRLVLTEGNYLLHTGAWARVSPLLNEVWYCEVAPNVRRERLVSRHVQFGKSEAAARSWVDEVDEPNAQVITNTRDQADLIIVSGSHPSVWAPQTTSSTTTHRWKQ